MNEETKIRELIDRLNSRVSESKKKLSEIRDEFLEEETNFIGLTLKLEAQKELLRSLLGSVTLNEVEKKNNHVDSAFRSKLDSLLTSVK